MNTSQVIQVFSGWGRVYTLVLFEGATNPTPVLVDTGSAELAVCPSTDMGNANATGLYGYALYGNGTYGWVGEWYEATAVFGTPEESVTDSKPIYAALISDENANLCNPNLKGILGVNFGGNYLYSTPQEIGNPQGGEETQRESFASTMLNEGDDYTMAFIGVTPDNSGSAVIAFGSAADEMLSRDTLVGSTPIQQNINSWYTLETPMTVSFQNVEGFIEGITYEATSIDNYPIIDSGTPRLVLPEEV